MTAAAQHPRLRLLAEGYKRDFKAEVNPVVMTPYRKAAEPLKCPTCRAVGPDVALYSATWPHTGEATVPLYDCANCGAQWDG